MLKTNLRNVQVHSDTCSCNYELYEKWYTVADFFPKLEFSQGFLYILNFTRRNSEAAMGGAGAGDMYIFLGAV